MELSAQEVRDIAELAKVGMSPEEIEVMRSQLSDILERFRALSEVDTDGVTGISLKEHLAFTLMLFDETDKDGNRLLTAAEVAAFDRADASR